VLVLVSEPVRKQRWRSRYCLPANRQYTTIANAARRHRQGLTTGRSVDLPAARANRKATSVRGTIAGVGEYALMRGIAENDGASGVARLLLPPLTTMLLAAIVPWLIVVVPV